MAGQINYRLLPTTFIATLATALQGAKALPRPRDTAAPIPAAAPLPNGPDPLTQVDSFQQNLVALSH